MNTKDQPAQASDEAQELRALANALENGGELSGSERRTVANALRHSQPSVQAEGVGDLAEKLFAEMCPGIPYLAEDRDWYEDLARAVTKLSPTPATHDHAAVVEALEEACDCIRDLGRSHEAKVAAGWAWEEVIENLQRALSTMSKAPQAGGAFYAREAMYGSLANDLENEVWPTLTVRQQVLIADACAFLRAPIPTPSSRAEPVASGVREALASRIAGAAAISLIGKEDVRGYLPAGSRDIIVACLRHRAEPVAKGFAVSIFGEIDVRSVSPEWRAAAVNWLVVNAGVFIDNDTTDKEIEHLWDTHQPLGGQIVSVTVADSALTASPLSPAEPTSTDYRFTHASLLAYVTKCREAWEAERAASPLSPRQAVVEADRVIGQIEERFPNWRSYRDLIDCIDCTLHDLRKGASR